MAHFVGLDVSVKETAVCVVDEVGEVVSEQKVPTEPDDIVTLLVDKIRRLVPVIQALARLAVGPLVTQTCRNEWRFRSRVFHP